MSNLIIIPQEVVSLAFSQREKITSDALRDIRIEVAQEYFIRPRFGQRMFEGMLDGRYAEFTNRYIKPALAQFVRHALIEELSVQIGEQGVLLYSSSKNEGRHTEEQTSIDFTTGKNDDELRGSSDKTITQSGSAIDNSREEETSLVERISQTEFAYIDNKKASIIGEVKKESSDTKTDNQTNTSRTVTTIEKNSTKNDDSKKQITDLGESMRPATLLEVRTIMARALSDGNILLARAVRYVESHSADFPDYVPSKIANRVFV